MCLPCRILSKDSAVVRERNFTNDATHKGAERTLCTLFISCYNLSMEKLTLEQISILVMEQAKAKGFGTTPEEINVAEKVALIHSEVSEAFQAYRHKNIKGKDGFEEEMGDVIQRILHLCGVLGVDIEGSILDKLAYNKDRKWNWDKMNESHS